MPHRAHDLLLLITNLSQQKEKDNIISLFCQGAEVLFPGYTFTWQADTIQPDQKRVFEVQTRSHLFGYLVVEPGEGIPEKIHCMLQNAVQMLAVILERIEHERSLEVYRNNLEEVIDTRTHDLILREIQYRNLFESMAQGVVYQDQEGKIKAANPAAERILGLSLDQMQGRTSTDPRWRSIHEDGRNFPGDEHPSMVALHTGKEVRNVVMGVFNPLKEEITWIRINAIPQFRLEEERPFQVFTTFDDITAQKNILDELAALSNRQDSILAAIPDIVVEVDEDKIYTWANKAGIDFFGVDIIGKPADYYFEGAQDTFHKVQPLFNGYEDVIYIESWQRRRDGKKRLLAWWCRVLKNKDGEVAGALSTARDITETRQLEQTLEERNQFIEALIDMQPNIVYIYDLVERTNKYTNDGMNRLLGYNTKEILQMGEQVIPVLMHPEDLTTYLNETLPRYLKAVDDEIIDSQFRMQHKNGDWRWLACSEVIFNRTADGSPRQILGVIHDITENKKAAGEILRLNLELEQRVADRTAALEAVNKELEAFAYSISHDLRAPLRAIEGYSAILQERHSGKLDAEGLRFLGVIRKSTKKMDQLITDLLNLSKITRKELNIRTVRMNEIIEPVLQEILSPEEQNQVKLTIGPLPDCSADPVLIRQVWANLLSNALKYTGKQKHRTISIGAREEPEGRITYWVKDNGVGFDSNYAEKIFGIFQRLHSDEEFEGTGVGLAIVSRIIRQHNGTVWAEGIPGKGATFYFTLKKI